MTLGALGGEFHRGGCDGRPGGPWQPLEGNHRDTMSLVVAKSRHTAKSIGLTDIRLSA